MKYRIRNWPEYNKNLVSRGDIHLFLPDHVLASWKAEHLKPSSKRGRPPKFSDSAILCALKIKAFFGLSYRALQGFVESLFESAGLFLPVPSYTQIAKRVQRLNLEVSGARRRYSEILVDSTGLKVVGQGEWLRKKHRNPDVSDWRKMHLAVCADSLEVTAVVTTDAHDADCSALPELLYLTGKRIGTVYGDGAYDTQGSYRAISDLGARAIIPPRINAKSSRNNDQASMARDDSVLQMIGLGGGEAGKALWKKLTGYHLRSLVENTMFRFKQMFGGRLWSRNRYAQETEVKVKILVLNDMTRQGMPVSVAVA